MKSGQNNLANFSIRMYNGATDFAWINAYHLPSQTVTKPSITVDSENGIYRVSKKKVYSSILGSIQKQYDVIQLFCSHIVNQMFVYMCAKF